MDVSIIVAVSTNDVIGRAGELPWYLPEDLKRFKAATMGKPIIMGRLTYESIGRPLPGRKNIVLSSRKRYQLLGCEVAGSVEEALQLAAGAEEAMIIGGGHIYQLFLPRANRIYLTRVHVEITGDTFFPAPDGREWQVTSEEEFPANSERDYGFSIQRLQRR
jgi:dihydrofolate reductase